MRRRSLVLFSPIVMLAMASCSPVMRAGGVARTARDPMLAAVNAHRAAAGVAPLTSCAALERAAERHSDDQAARDAMSHTGSDGSTFVQRAQRARYGGWSALGENVAFGYPTVVAVVDGWMHSAGHRANILNATYTHFGSGYARSADGTPYWTQDFGRGGTC